MSANEVIIISENTQGNDQPSVIEVINVGPSLVVESLEDQSHLTVADVIEAILDSTPDVDLPDNFVETHYAVASDFGGELAYEPPASGEHITSEPQSSQADQVGDEAQQHADAASEAQLHSDEAVAAGDYATAAQAREDAENEAWEAGNSDMLHGSSSADLDLAANQQEDAHQFEQQESRDAQAGDYEAARDDAAHAADATGWADYNAGGSDHTGQPDHEYDQENWAVWEQDSAEADHLSADAYAADGEVDTAAQYEANAAEHQAEAEHHGEMGDHDQIVDHDASSDVTHDSGSESYHATDYSHESDDSYDS